MLIVILILGLIFGSFISALVWRLHETDKQLENKSKKTKDNLSIINGRSICPNCRHILGPLDLVPVLSWLFLGGKCRYCHKPISIKYPFIELLTGFFFALSYECWPLSLKGLGLAAFIIWLIILVFLIALAVYDLKWYILPNKLVYTLCLLAFAQLVIISFYKQSHLLTLLGGFWGILVLGGLFYALFQVSDGKWIGGGDIKLAVAIGLIVGGPIMSIMMLFFASIIGVIITLPLLFTKKLKIHSQIPFGPLLIVSTVIVVLFGQHILNFYKSFL